MGRKKKEDIESEAPPEIDSDGSATGPSEEAPSESSDQPKKRGPRGPYKKRKQKVAFALPDELVAQVALMPFMATNAVLGPRKGVVLAVNPQIAAAIPVVFKAWLDDIGFELTPGWALVALYASALVTAQKVPVERAREAAKASTAEKTVEGTSSQIQ